MDDNAAAAVDDNAAAATLLPEPGPVAPTDPRTPRRIMTMPKPAAESSSPLNYKKDKKGKDFSKKDKDKKSSKDKKEKDDSSFRSDSSDDSSSSTHQPPRKKPKQKE